MIHLIDVCCKYIVQSSAFKLKSYNAQKNYKTLCYRSCLGELKTHKDIVLYLATLFPYALYLCKCMDALEEIDLFLNNQKKKEYIF